MNLAPLTVTSVSPVPVLTTVLPRNVPTPVTLALRLEGYEPVSQQVSAANAPELTVKLTQKQKPRRPPPPPPQLGIKTDR